MIGFLVFVVVFVCLFGWLLLLLLFFLFFFFNLNVRRKHTNLDSTDTDDKSKSTKENPSEGDFPSAWEPSAAAAPAGDDLWTFPAENDNDYSNYNTEGGFAAAFEGVGFDVAVFEEDKVISFQDTGSSLFQGDLVVLGIWIPLAICTPNPLLQFNITGGDFTDGDEKPASSAKEGTKLDQVRVALFLKESS